MKRYNVGDEVWLAEYDLESVKKTCPICFGQKQVILILGNDDKVILPCDYCGKGFNEPTGVITEYEYVAKATLIVITKIQSETNELGEQRKYYFNAHYAAIEDLFNSKEAALARCAEKIKRQELEDTTKAYRIKANHLKSYSWNAGYHLREALHHEKQAGYHKQKAALCKERAK
jgi:hypothetical protein